MEGLQLLESIRRRFLLGIGDLFILEPGPLFLLIFDQEPHFPAAFFENDKVFMLDFHKLLVFPLLELKFAQLVLGNPELFVQLGDFAIVLTLFVQSLKGFFLLNLYFQKGL